MAMVKVDAENCKECRLCIGACPFRLLEIGNEFNSKGYRYVVQSDDSKCTGCKLCAIMCPDSVISVYK
jgi:2-oxoglutarate ferredoxin oxidoreductase subunit delta